MSSALRRNLQARATVLRAIRSQLDADGYVEVQTPSVARGVIFERGVAPIQTGIGYLQPSPERAMKALLSRGSGDIYQVTHAFRDDPLTPEHRREFVIAEWYTLGASWKTLANHTVHVISGAMKTAGGQVREVTFASWLDLWSKYIDISHNAPLSALRQLAMAKIGLVRADDCTREDLLDILFSELAQQHMPPSVLTVVHDWPAISSLLAAPAAPGFAARFEVYYGSVELANGCEELTDPTELKRRWDAHDIPADGRDAVTRDMTEQLPPCSGVAVGVDRLVMAALNARRIWLPDPDDPSGWPSEDAVQ